MTSRSPLTFQQHTPSTGLYGACMRGFLQTITNSTTALYQESELKFELSSNNMFVQEDCPIYMYAFIYIYVHTQFHFDFRSPSVMGILVADRTYLGEIEVPDEGIKVYGGENVELGIRVSTPHLSHLIKLTLFIYSAFKNSQC